MRPAQIHNSKVSPLCHLMALALVVTLGCFVEAGAQWTTNGNNINNTNSGNVGVGTSSPDRKLRVNTTSSENEEVISVYRSAASNTTGGRSRVSFEFRGDAYSDNPNVYGWGLFPGGAMAKISAAPQSYTELGSVISGNHASLGFFVSSAGHGGLLERMTILGNGKVGVGTSTPGYLFDVQGGAVNASGGLCIAGDCKTSWASLGGTQWTTSSEGISYSSGRVGIGVSSPQRTLHVHSSANTVFQVTDNTTGNQSTDGFQFVQAGLTSYLENQEAGSMIFRTSATNRVAIDSSGKVGIGTMTPTKPLDVVGDLNASGTITGGTITAKYQDVAEWVDSSQEIPVGTVVVLDTSKSNHVIAATQSYDSNVAGVISLRPGLVLGEGGEGRVLVATTGRVKVKVDATNGPIKIGDLLVTSDREGYAMKSTPIDVGGARIHRPGTLIGKALEPLAKGTGEILVLLSLQ